MQRSTSANPPAHPGAAGPVAARDYPDGVAPWRQRLDRAVVGSLERTFRWGFAHWLLLANAVVALTLLGAVAAPLLAAAGFEAASGAIHTAYLLLCPQRPAHSYFLAGHQLALEHREMAMFGAQLGGGLLFGLLRGRWHGRLGVWWLVLLSLPMAWDGFSQMFGLRESDWQTRTWTGALMAIAFVFWLYPLLEYRFRTRRGLR